MAKRAERTARIVDRLQTGLKGVALIALMATASAAAADEQIYSYEPASASARLLTQTGLSFEFERHGLGGTRIHRIVQTGERGSAALKPSSDKDMGPGGLKAALGRDGPVGGLYEIVPDGDGQAFVGAVCPGAQRAWLIIGPLKRFRDLEIQAVGLNEGGKSAHRCANLAFTFYNEWAMPPGSPPPRARFPRNQP